MIVENLDEEVVLWQGRPAPRCFTFRLWKQALAGSLLFLVSSFWLMLALELVRDGYPFWLVLFPVPLIFCSLVFGPLQILIARWRWPHVFYVLTATEFIVPKRSLPLAAVVDIKIKKQGERLASLRLRTADGQTAILHCIEEPDTLLALLKSYCPGVIN